MDARVSRQTVPLRGDVPPPSDKSISHRAVLFAAMAEGVSNLTGVLDSDDVRSTMAAVTALGADVHVIDTRDDGLSLQVRGWGPSGPIAPSGPIDCGNSGTTARLLMGVLAGWPVEVTFVGDSSLTSRPMRRVTDPLAIMGAQIVASDRGTLPLQLRGGSLTALAYRSPIASAQVKSAVLLAGLGAPGTTSVSEPARSRNHTERMLPAFGVPVQVSDDSLTASVDGPVVPRATDVSVPGDPSSAAFLAVAAAIVPGSCVVLNHVSLNPTRAGFVRVLERMGASVELREPRSMGGEDVGSLRVRHAAGLAATTIAVAEVPSLIDEIPILAVAASQAAGTTRFEGVGELRVKESDRLEATRAALQAFGASVSVGEDWIEITGPTQLRAARVASLGDHRLAMAWVVAGLVAEGETIVTEFEAVDVSYPAFAHHLSALGATISVA